jgi:hypothetical protein
MRGNADIIARQKSKLGPVITTTDETARALRVTITVSLARDAEVIWVAAVTSVAVLSARRALLEELSGALVLSIRPGVIQGDITTAKRHHYTGSQHIQTGNFWIHRYFSFCNDRRYRSML